MTDLHTELKPCPFCQTCDHVSLVAIESMAPNMPGRPHQVRCHHIDCEGVAGPIRYGQAEAIAAWNARTNPELDTLRAKNAEVVTSLEKIAVGDGVYGAQAHEYKQIARATLATIREADNG